MLFEEMPKRNVDPWGWPLLDSRTRDDERDTAVFLADGGGHAHINCASHQSVVGT